MKKQSKVSLSRKLLILVLTIFMLGSTTMSFAFWLNNINDASDSLDIGVVIGSGSTVDAVLDLGNPQNNNSSRLVPHDLTSFTPTGKEVTSIYFSIPVTWNPEAARDITTTGELTVKLSSISALYGNDKLMNEIGFKGNSLFEVSVAYGSSDIADEIDFQAAFSANFDDVSGGNSSTRSSIPMTFEAAKATQDVAIYVYVRIRLTEPKDQAQYEMIANKQVETQLTFTLTTDEVV